MSPITTGVLLALAAAATFGITTPLIQRFGLGLGPFTTAGLLYAGAAGLALLVGRGSGEAPLRRAHLPRLALVALFGAFIAPVLLALGLRATSGTSASLLLTGGRAHCRPGRPGLSRARRPAGGGGRGGHR